MIIERLATISTALRNGKVLIVGACCGNVQLAYWLVNVAFHTCYGGIGLIGSLI